jgi:hypothetical protein
MGTEERKENHQYRRGQGRNRNYDHRVNLAASLNQTKGSPSVALIDMNLLFRRSSHIPKSETVFSWELVRNISGLIRST